MPKDQYVSIAVIRRLPRYHRFLGELLGKGVTRISSRELSQLMNLTASQIRQDLNCFGGFGQQGYGYNVEGLYGEIGRILGLDHNYPAVLIGVGNLGRAMISHIDFPGQGFSLLGVFDKSPLVIGQPVGNHIVQDVSTLLDFCREHKPVAAIFCTPDEAVEEIARALLEVGVRGFWNFTHHDISIEHPEAVVENVHLGDSLMTLCYRVNEALGNKQV